MNLLKNVKRLFFKGLTSKYNASKTGWKWEIKTLDDYKVLFNKNDAKTFGARKKYIFKALSFCDYGISRSIVNERYDMTTNRYEFDKADFETNIYDIYNFIYNSISSGIIYVPTPQMCAQVTYDLKCLKDDVRNLNVTDTNPSNFIHIINTWRVAKFSSWYVVNYTGMDFSDSLFASFNALSKNTFYVKPSAFDTDKIKAAYIIEK